MHAVFAESYPQVVAGQQRELHEVLKVWCARGHRATVSAPADGPVRPPFEAAGASYEVFAPPARLRRYGGAVYADGPAGKALNAAAAARHALAGRGELRRLAPDVLYCNDARAWLTLGVAAKSLGVPVIHWDKLDKPHGRGGWMDRLELPLCDRVMFISEGVKDKFSPEQLARYADKCVVVNDGIDPADLDATAPDRARFGATGDDLLIAVVGTVTRRKGIDRLMTVWGDFAERFPHAELAVAGGLRESADDAAFFESLPHRGHPRVKWLGFRDDARTLLKSADLFVFLSRNEGLPRVVTEAMAARLPTLCTPISGVREQVVDGETGFLVDGDDPAEVLARLCELAGDADLRRRMGDAGRARMERHFHGPTQIGRVADEIEGLAAGRGAKSA